ncbi:hypothetical protein BC941DRAFT_466804 [Chlamydoabsidia padenii]|nr:hypothetical protein BC941DRAFT_466804 [Chlamydoabsidia padenii]
MSNTYLERRRRTRFPTFAMEAQQWMARDDSLAEFFGYSPVEMAEGLQVVLEGQAFNGLMSCYGGCGRTHVNQARKKGNW